MYRYFIGPMLQQALKQIEAMVGETLQPLETIVIHPFLTVWDPSVTLSNPREWNSSRLLLMILWKIFKNISYLWLPGNILELVVTMLGL